MDHDTFASWFVNAAFILGVVFLILRTALLFKRTPHVDVDFSEIKKDLGAIQDALKSKQDETICTNLHSQMQHSMAEIKARQRDLEKKQSSDVSKIFSRVEALANSVSSDIGGLKGTLTTYINLREKQ